MGDVLTHHDVCEQFFANREPSLGEWRELRAAGVPLDALCRPQMVLAGDIIVDGPHSFGFAAKAGAAAQSEHSSSPSPMRVIASSTLPPGNPPGNG